MQTQSKIFLAIGIFILIIILFVAFNSGSSSQMAATEEPSAVTQADTDKMEKEEKMNAHPDTETDMETGEEAMPRASEAPLAAGVYTDYTPDAVAGSQAEHIVLNFSATWCPSCRTLDKNINENVSEIPDGVEIYKVDFDSSTELKKKYGITTQHTLVVVNPDGTMVKKWVGGSTLSGLVAQL
jgi:thiol-disulfide isomerase/thioredoxin